uniref:Uncharacterized protein n=1 Tax=Glossina brevipalpis TaxID=37001 RepID=A0A1A9WFF4_9MUSC
MHMKSIHDFANDFEQVALVSLLPLQFLYLLFIKHKAQTAGRQLDKHYLSKCVFEDLILIFKSILISLNVTNVAIKSCFMSDSWRWLKTHLMWKTEMIINKLINQQHNWIITNFEFLPPPYSLTIYYRKSSLRRFTRLSRSLRRNSRHRTDMRAIELLVRNGESAFIFHETGSKLKLMCRSLRENRLANYNKSNKELNKYKVLLGSILIVYFDVRQLQYRFVLFESEKGLIMELIIFIR